MEVCRYFNQSSTITTRDNGFKMARHVDINTLIFQHFERRRRGLQARMCYLENITPEQIWKSKELADHFWCHKTSPSRKKYVVSPPKRCP